MAPRLFLVFLATCLWNNLPLNAQEADHKFEVTFTKEVCPDAFTGRVLIMLGRGGEPRTGPNWFSPQPFFAKDVTDWKPGDPMFFGNEMISFPAPLNKLKPGKYRVQAVLDRDLGDREIGNGAGNGYSKAESIEIEAGKPVKVTLKIDQVVPDKKFKETGRVKLVDIESKLLSDFHKKPMRLQAAVILPIKYDEPNNKDRKYPLILDIPGFSGNHFSAFGQAMSNPTNVAGVDMLYAVLNPDCRTGHHVFADSANNGPYGEALIKELIPAIETKFRAIAKPYARLLTGHSSGGWTSLWLQVAYPDYFGGTWSTSPDPVDFRDFQRINIYASGTNMFVDEKKERRPLARRGETPFIWYKDFSDMETVMGRGGQLYSFEAVFSPKGPDGKPMQLWDRKTGALSTEVAKAWEKYDIRLKLEKEWKTLSPKLAGKLHVYMGDLDTFYLEGATIKLKETLRQLGSDAEVVIVPKADHGSIIPAIHQSMVKSMADTFNKNHAKEAK